MLQAKFGKHFAGYQKFYDHCKLSNNNYLIVTVYVKLPSGFYINTPVGKYNPDWAIVFHEGKVKHIYFVGKGQSAS
jgi:restriction endonuclease